MQPLSHGYVLKSPLPFYNQHYSARSSRTKRRTVKIQEVDLGFENVTAAIMWSCFFLK